MLNVLHGIACDEMKWRRFAQLDPPADKKPVPVIAPLPVRGVQTGPALRM